MARTTLRFAPGLLLALGVAACGAAASQPPETTTLSGASGAPLPPQPDIGSSADAGDGSASSGADGHGGSGDHETDAGQAGDSGVSRSDGGDAADSGPPDPATLWASRALPPFDAATVAHVRALLSAGADQGKLPTSLAKIGDQLTASPDYLVDAGSWACIYGDYGSLNAMTFAATATQYDDQSNAFTRASAAAVSGWKTADAVRSAGVATELSFTSASAALIIIGSNDLASTPVADYVTSLGALVDAVEGSSVVAILSTLPDRSDSAAAAASVGAYNDAIRQLAASRHLPLVDVSVGFATLARHGITADGVTPTIVETKGGSVSRDLSADGLSYGADLRNLLALEVLDRVWRLR